MAKSDQGYTRGRGVQSGVSGGRGMSEGTYLAKTKKQDLTHLYLRTQTQGIIDALGIEPTSDMAMEIRQGALDAYTEGANMTKEELFAATTDSMRGGKQALNNNKEAIRRFHEAEVLLAALESATRPKERGGLDTGGYLDDLASLTLDGSGWAEESLGAKQYRKHINICIDNSGSTRMPATGYCARAMSEVATNLMEVLYEAAGKWPHITWDEFSFNRIAQIHTGLQGAQDRAEAVRQSLAKVRVSDPLDTDARETNLAPLVQAMHANEVERGLVGEPRIDIILTDGEFEGQDDSDEAAEYQRQRGSGVTTYIINLCPDTPSDVTLPHQFRVIPLHCITGTAHRKEVDGEALRQTLMRIVVEEMQQNH